MKKLICVTGIDGAGKSTLINALHDQLENSVIANIWQSMVAENGLFHSKDEVYRYMMSLTPNSRVLFLAHALQYGLEKAMNTTSEVVLIDGHYFKYFGPELVIGADEKLVQKLTEIFPVPDVTICLEIDPEKSFNRKENITAYECGFKGEVNKENFLNFQRAVLAKRDFFDTSNWTYIDSHEDEKVILEKSLKLIHPAQ